jgi:CRISPR-associated endonuclease/helicase Cas3
MREDEEAVPLGVVLVAGAETVETDDDDGSSFTGRPQALEEHVNHVLSLAETFANGLGLDDTIKRALTLAARHHDDGKRDPRFQDFLRAAAGATAEKIPADLAKSGVRASRGEERRLREAAGLPQPWRHEVLSAQLFAERYAPNTQQGDREMVDLALWLIGTHHGQGRPFFRHVDPWDGIKRKVGDVELTDAPGPHRLDFDWDGDAWADLFETLKRRYGYWGLAYLEAVLRLADHRASENLCQKNGRDNGGVNGTSKQS